MCHKFYSKESTKDFKPKKEVRVYVKEYEANTVNTNRVLLRNVDAHNVNVTGRVQYII